MRKLTAIVLSVSLTACTLAKEPNATYYTFGAASIEKCEKIVKTEAGEEKFNCNRYGSDGFSTVFGTMMTGFFAWAVWPW